MVRLRNVQAGAEHWEGDEEKGGARMTTSTYEPTGSGGAARSFAAAIIVALGVVHFVGFPRALSGGVLAALRSRAYMRRRPPFWLSIAQKVTA